METLEMIFRMNLSSDRLRTPGSSAGPRPLITLQSLPGRIAPLSFIFTQTTANTASLFMANNPQRFLARSASYVRLSAAQTPIFKMY